MKHLILSSSVFVSATMLLGLSACGDGLIDMQAGEVQEERPLADNNLSELMYLRSPEAVQAAFNEMGEAQFFPKQAFYGMGLMLTATGAPDVSYRFKDTNGQWSQWQKAALEGHNDKYYNFHTTMPEGATALALKTQSPLEFMRVEFAKVLDTEHNHDFLDDPVIGESHEQASLTETEALKQGISKSGRWALSSSARSKGESQYVRYDSAPSYNNGRNCSGTFTKGARDLGNYLVQNFAGAKYFQGYNCRRIRGRSGMSMHGTGRAIDVFVPLHNGQADNTLGDPIGEWLVKNAAVIGVQYIVWDRTSWGGSRSGRKDRYYSGAHPHHDHYHIELTKAAAARQTQWFKDRGVASDPTNPGPAPTPGSCYSNTLGKSVANGEGVQVNYASPCANNGSCGWYKCSNGSWTCTSPDQTSKQHPHASCQPAQPQQPSQPAVTCKSSTLGRDVPAGEYVQMPYAACASQSRCQWAVCGNDGKWQCDSPGANATKNPHAQCAPAPSIDSNACNSSTLGRKVAEGSRVQMAYNSCGGTCQWAECQGTKWMCVGDGNAAASYPHSSCR